ncbi:hypothetical protein Aconfl_02640 [Algoriphagus confluentis]|uniref:Uncharacterized protein n=2 Tax=Algoriphagus confluentis TaxID=1697556 RepID=A0ABQ6PL98_9BACT|nr:hypothetical protein Aconfl_02640 [Algoriphagus confluentis]
MSRIKGNSLCKAFFWLVLLNFINLSVNFQESQISHPENLDLQDPIDTLGELVYEWALNGDCDVIPDNGTEQEDKSPKKGKVWGVPLELVSLHFSSLPYKKKHHFDQETLISSSLPKPFSPPDLS